MIAVVREGRAVRISLAEAHAGAFARSTPPVKVLRPMPGCDARIASEERLAGTKNVRAAGSRLPSA